MLLGSVRAQKVAGNITYNLAAPCHFKPGLLGDPGHDSRFKVLGSGKLCKALNAFGRQNDSHPLLGLADGKLGAVKAVILLRHLVKVYLKAVGQLADGDGYAARTEVVAPFYKLCGFGVSEQALELPFLGGVALLDFGPAGLKALTAVALG